MWAAENYNAVLKNKLVGGVFGREQYKNAKGELKWSTKCQNFRTVAAIKKGVKVPDDKYLPEEQGGSSQPYTANSTPSRFMDLDDENDDLPF